MRIKIGRGLIEIPDNQWESYLANTLIKCPEKPKDESKIKKALGYTWYLDDEKK